LAQVGTSNAEAFRQYMLGSFYYRNRDKDYLEKSIGYFREAINLDPLYADAYAGLADCYLLSNTVGYGNLSTEDAKNRAKWAANEALRLNENLPGAHTALAVISLKYDWNWVAAEKEIKRALELNPDFAPAHYAYSMLLTVLNRQNEAIQQSKITRDLDPFSTSTKTNYCRSFYYARDFDLSVSCFREILKDDQNNTLAKYVSGFVDLQKGNKEAAIDVFEKLYAKNPTLGASALGYAYGKSGRKDDALKILSYVQDHRDSFPAQELAIIHLGLGNKSDALSWLETAYEDHFSLLIYLMVEPIFDELHSEPRFIAIAQRMNLTPVEGN
jgi:tetratricopeptide (TPR) repeat protein